MSELQFLRLAREGSIATVFLNRPKQLNALSMDLMDELVALLEELDGDESVRTIVLTGNEKAFAAGADITDMADADAATILKRDQFAKWDRIRRVKKPLIAAVSGFC